MDYKHEYRKNDENDIVKCFDLPKCNKVTRDHCEDGGSCSPPPPEPPITKETSCFAKD